MCLKPSPKEEISRRAFLEEVLVCEGPEGGKTLVCSRKWKNSNAGFWQMTVKLLFRKQLLGVPGSGNRQKSQRLEPTVTDYVGSRAWIRFFNSRTVPISYTEKEARKGSFHISAEFLQHLGPRSVQLTHIYVRLTTSSYPIVRLYRLQVNQFTWVILSVLIT